MRSVKSVASSALAAALLVASNSANAQEYVFSCQPDSRYTRIMHLQDVSPDAESTTMQGLLGGALATFDTWLATFFSDGPAQGIYRFSDKQVFTGVDGFCADSYAPLSTDPILPIYQNLPLATGNDSPSRSVLDVLWRLRNFNWNSPFSLGRRIAFVYTTAPAHLPPANIAGIGPFDQSDNCELVDYPSVAELQAELIANFVRVVFVVPPNLVQAYKDLFNTDLVVPFSTVPDAQFEALYNAMHSVYCPVPIPTQEPQGSGPTIIFTDPTTAPPPCTENAILQLLHIQDISHSYTNDLQNMINKFPDLITSLQGQFYKTELALASFSDKPTGDSGYPGDYCYREDHIFTVDETSYINSLNNDLNILSGRDWKESQYDAMLFGVLSNTLGWESNDVVDGRRVLRVAMVATDAGPHVAGDLAAELPAAGATCFDRDYPSPNELGAALGANGVHPMFVVTSDIYNYWLGKAADVSPDARVFQLADDSSVLFQAIQDALEDLCEAELPQ